jgi:PPM family protein phosphatase
MNGFDRGGSPRLRSIGKTDPGLRRSNNEDVYISRPELGLFAVADGMGGAASGEVASQVFAEAALEVFSGKGGASEQDVLERVQQAFRVANERILSKASQDARFQGMGCTAELVTFYNQNYVLGHVGDSRTYLFRQGQLKQLTLDHSLVQDQIDRGLITAEEARRHSLRNVILRAVGINEVLAVDLVRGKSLSGDLLLLCSDGLTDMVEDGSIQHVLSLSMSVSQKAERLIELAKSAGGHDNITVVLCEVTPS